MSGDGAYRYAVSPAGEIFETRHEAVGFAAVHGRKYTYSPMNSIDGPISLRIDAFRYDDTDTDRQRGADDD
jgi:hypothetical protein